MATLASLVVKLTGDIGGFSSAMDNAAGKLRATGASMMSTGAGLTAGVTLPLVGIGVAALHVAGEFEQSMNMMQAVSGATAEEMAAVSAAAIALGSDLTLPGTSASDAGAAMVELSRAGLSVQESMDAARGVLQLSAAAQIGNAQAATITAQALNTFGLAGTEAARVANLLAGGANASSAEITDMAAALQMSGSVAASMGMPIEHLTTAIGLMANAGIVGSDAGTSLKTMLMRLGAPTQEATALMRSLGISVFDSAGNMLPMPAIIGQFTGALSGMSMEQRNAALATLFGADAIRAANVVLMGGTDAWAAMEAAVTAEGQAQALAAAQTSGFQGALDGLRSVVETVLLTVGTPFLAMLTGWVQWLASLLERITAIDPGLLNMIVMIGLVAAAIGPLLMVLGSLVSGLGIVAGAIGFLLSPIGLVILAVAALAAAVVAHFGGVQATIEAASAFVQGVLATLSAFVASNQEEMLGWVDAAWTQIQAIVTSLVNGVEQVVRAVLTVVSGFINAHGAEIEGFVRTAWQQIGTIINLALTLINEVVTRVLSAVATFIDAHGAEIQMILTVAWNLIRGIIQTALDLIEGIIRVALAMIRGDWEEAWALVQTYAAMVWDDIRALIETTLTAIWQLVERIAGQVRDFLIDAWQQIKQKGIEAFHELRDRILGALSDLVGGMYERGAAMVRAFADGITSALERALDAARRLVQQIRDLLPGSDAKAGPLSDLTASGSALPATLAVGIGHGGPAAVGAAAGLAGQIMGVLGGMASTAGDTVEQMLGGMAQQIVHGAPDVAGALGGALGGLGQQAAMWAGGGVGAVDEYLGGMAQQIVHGAPDVVDALGGMVQQIVHGAPDVAGALGGVLGSEQAASLGTELGLNWIDAMIKAISARLPVLQATVGEVWASLGGANGGRADGWTGRPAMAVAPGGWQDAPGGGGRWGDVTVNMYGPWQVRDDGDIERIGEKVAEWLAQRTATTKRLMR